MIKRLYVHNYRCLENFDLSLGDRSSTLLIGRNGTGKSTVRAAFELVQQIGRGTNRVGMLLNRSDLGWGRDDVPIRFEIEVVLDRRLYHYSIAFELPAGFKELRVAQESLVADGMPVYAREHSEVVLSRTARDNEAKFLLDWHLVALPIIQEHSESDPIYVFKRWISRSVSLAPIPMLMRGASSGGSLVPEKTAGNIGEWFTGLLAHSPAAYSEIDRYLRNVFPDLLDIRNPLVAADSRSLVIRFRAGDRTIEVPFESLSDGEKCYFVCALVLAANATYGPLACFWDEPDAHLALAEVGHFIVELRKAFREGGQLILSTHNPEAIRRFSLENTLLLERRSHLEPTILRQVADLELSGDLADSLTRGDIG